MKPRPFDYARPDSVAEAVALLAEHGDSAKVLAGGMSLMAMLNLRLADPEMLIDIGRLLELGEIKEIDGKIEIGAAVTQNKLLAWGELKTKLPLVAAALPHVGHFQTRNKGTVCGSIAHADPSSELPLSLAVCGGEVVLRSQRGTRVVAARDFQIGMLMTARAADELITHVRFPVAKPSTCVGFREVARRHGDFAIVAVAAMSDGPDAVRLGVGGVAGHPAVRTVKLDRPGAAIEAVERLAWELEGYEDIHASARMRRDILRRIAPAVIEEARLCAA